MNSLNEQPWHLDVITNCGLRTDACSNVLQYSVVSCNYVTEGSLYLCSNSKLVFWDTPRKCFNFIYIHTTYSRTALIVINWHGQPSRYAENPDNWIFFENRSHWQFEVRLLLFTECTCVWTFRPRLIWSSRSHNTILYLIRYPEISSHVSFP